MLWVSNEQRQHSASVLRSIPHTKGGTKRNTRVPEVCQCTEPLRLHNTSHGKTKQLPRRAGSGSMQCYSSARAGWGHAEYWRGGGTVIQKQHPPANGWQLLTLQPCSFQQLSRADPPVPPLLGGKSWMGLLGSTAENSLGLHSFSQY